MSRRAQAGFSLVELIIAMIITVIVCGSIYGLIASGQSAFVREPELADRQQNLRMAMDVIMRDLGTAGEGLAMDGRPSFVQVFTRTSPNESGGSLNNCVGNAGLNGTPGQGSCVPSTNVLNENADDLEMLASPLGDCGAEELCGYGSAASNAFLKRDGTCIQPNEVVVFLNLDGSYTLRTVDRSFGNAGKGPGEPQCEAHGHAALGFKPNFGPEGINVSPADLCNPNGLGNTGPGCEPRYVTRAQLITYHVRRDTDGMPCLWRRATGNLAGTFQGSFQLVARGIEDLQVQYAVADANPATPVPEEQWSDQAPAVVGPAVNTVANATNFGSLTTRVRVTLTARANTANMIGANADVTGGNRARRGNLTSTAVIRSALNSIATDKNLAAMWQ